MTNLESSLGISPYIQKRRLKTLGEALQSCLLALQVDTRLGIWVEAPLFCLQGSLRPARHFDFWVTLSQVLCRLPAHHFDLLQNRWSLHCYGVQTPWKNLTPKHIITGKLFARQRGGLAVVDRPLDGLSYFSGCSTSPFFIDPSR